MIAPLRITPLAVLVANLLLAVLGVILTLGMALTQPWLGITFAVPETGPGLVVIQIADNAPALGAINVGERLIALRTANARVPLAAQDLLEEPDFLRAYTNYNAFMRKQDRLFRVLEAPSLGLVSPAGTSRSIRPATMRPLDDLLPAFWFQLAFAVACLGIAAAVWAFQRNTAGAMFYLTGLGLFVVGLTAAVYSTRELALGQPLFRILAAADHAGGMLFGGAFLGTLWHYPRQLTRAPAGTAMLALYALIWTLDTLQWLPDVDGGVRIPGLAGLGVEIVLAVVQWRRLDSPLDRAALRWFLFAWFFGSSLFAALMFVPVLLGLGPLLPQSYSFGLLLLIYLGVAAGVSRYRLFHLERWWYPTLAGSAALLVALIVLPLLLRFSRLSHLVTALVVMGVLGWVYFPLRGWLARRSFRRAQKRNAPMLHEAITLLFDRSRSDDIDQLWAALLQQLFNPLQFQTSVRADARPEVSANGSTLHIPATAHTRACTLRWPAHGSRLFDPADIGIVEALLPLISATHDLRAAWDSGAKAERARIKGDLEDDLATRLYGQILRAPNNATAAGARSALAEVRLVIDQLDPRGIVLAQALQDWRAQIEDICDIAGIPLAWLQPSDPPAVLLGPRWRGNPLRILREAAMNAIDHAHPTHMEVAIEVDLPDIVLVLSHDGVDRMPGIWEKGRGLLNVDARAKQLAGEVAWTQSQPGSVTMQARLTLEQAG